jgi:hypothetical protein
MDADYLKSTVSDALVQGLATVVESNPHDPVDFLGNYLLQFVATKQLEAKLAAEDEQFEVDKKEAAARAAAEEERMAPFHAAVHSRQKTVDDLVSKLATATDVSDVYAEVVSVLQQVTGATGVYIGVRERGNPEDEEDLDSMHFIAASEGHDFMLEKRIAADSGVVHDAWKLPEQAEEEEEEEEDEDNPRPPKPEPQFPTVHITNVLKEKRMQLYQVPRLGAFLAVPFKYASPLITDAIPPPPEPEEGEEEAAAADDADSADAASAVEEEAGEPEATEEPIRDPNTAQVDMVVCCDTMGQGRAFSDDEVAFVEGIAKKLSDALARSERSMYDTDFRGVLAAEKENAMLLAQQTEAAEGEEKRLSGEIEEAVAALGDDAKDDEKELATGEVQLKDAKDAVSEAADRLLAFGSRRIPPASGGPEETVLALTLYALGTPREALTNAQSKSTETLRWARMRNHVGSPAFTEAIAKWDPAPASDPVGPYATHEAIKEALEGVDVAALKASSTAVATLVPLLQAGLRVAAAAAAKRAREEEEAAAAAAAAAEAEAAAAAAAAEGEDGEEGSEED